MATVKKLVRPEKPDTGINFAKLLARPNPDGKFAAEWAVKGMFPVGFVTLLISEPKSGKTFLCLRLACELSRGGDVLGGLCSVDPVNVLYFQGDTGESLINYRLWKTGWTHDAERLRFTYSEAVRQQGADIDLGSSEGRAIFETLLLIHQPRIIFVDTLTNFHSVEENDNTAIKPIVQYLSNVAASRNIAIVILHHTRKRRKSESNQAITQSDTVGAGVLARLVGNIISVERREVEEGEIHTVRSVASWFKPFRSFTFALVDKVDETGREWLEMPIKHETPILRTNKQIIFDTILVHFPDGTQFTRQEVINFTGLSSVTVSKTLNLMVTEGELLAHGTTKNKTFSLPTGDIGKLIFPD